jgi:hypothetical protein
MLELISSFAFGVAATVGAQLVSPKVSDVIGNIHRSRALSKAKALIAAAEANNAALAAARKAVAAAAVPLPAPPPNPLATTGSTGPAA